MKSRDLEKPIAAEGGEPAFDTAVPIIRPNLPEWRSVEDRLKEIYDSRMLTNSKTVQELEKKFASFLGVKRTVALSSCTAGLILLMKSLGIRGEVIVPSFTFSATGHSIFWAGATPVFVDCDSGTWNISPDAVRKAVSDRTEAILAVHIFGNPGPVRQLEELAGELNLPLLFDSAHGFGGSVGSRRIGGFGKAEMFSLSPTKLLTGGEGGLLATDDLELADMISALRNYGHSSGYDCFAPGINARMPEFNAAMLLEGLHLVDGEIIKREKLSGIYRKLLSELPGITFQRIEKDNQHTYKDFTILINPGEFGMDRDQLHHLLEKENIQTKKYFYPPLHLQSAYEGREFRCGDLSFTEKLSENVLTLPLYSALGAEGVRKIAETIIRVHHAVSAESSARDRRMLEVN
ncbi:MAG: aminotransferase class I/II-fold pyridoxal phosphate-dependent enzyme [Candidatus Latescibacteria bacterium]|nr:aminotransferase class I/II-fold pyridoxal phosphate-dependent enzyme [bacterium]MBD3423856.1 aminotransferase class I/II-fold pyridoxal phosphate-dependent enzyme [Candidatus Latescibacterota bacterium]